jgi:ribosome recycling factor
MNDIKALATDETLSSAGVDQTESQEVENALNSQEIQDEIKALSKDGKFTEDEQNKIGEMVADKASEALEKQGKEGLSTEEKMAVAEYCSKCFDTDANRAVEESAQA